MFRKPSQTPPSAAPASIERVTSVLGAGINWRATLQGSGGVRIEGVFEGEIALNGMVVIGESGKVTCPNLRAKTVIVAGMVTGSITAERLEIRSTGQVWGDVVVTTFTTEEGAFLRGQVRMEDDLDLGLETPPAATGEPTETPA